MRMQLFHSPVATVGFCSLGLAAAALTPINTPSPMLQPAFGHCMQFHIAGQGEDCNAIIAASQLSRTEFFRINPAVGGEGHCKDKIIPHIWYCVRAKDPGEAQARPPSSPHPTLTPTKISSPFEKSGHNDSDKKRPGGGDKKDEIEKDRGRETEREPELPKPKITQGPAVPERCFFGACWSEFAQLSFKGGWALNEASELCTRLFNTKCVDHNKLGFPDAVNEGCKNCDELSSGCPCFTGGKYHTYTNGPMFHREWFNNPPPVFGPN